VFDWTIVPASALGSLPAGAWRLLVSDRRLDPRDASRLIERGGIVAGVAEGQDALIAMARAAGLRLDLIIPETDGECRYLGRRED